MPADFIQSVVTRATVQVNADTSYLETLFQRYGLINISDIDSSIRVELKYADTANFLGFQLYDGLRRAYLTCDAAWRLSGAQMLLKREHPNYTLLVLDATRPNHIQQVMWDSLKMHPERKQFYLAKPGETSLHNYGCAVDVTILDLRSGKQLDMGTPYDSFDKLSEPIYEKKFLKSGELSDSVVSRRWILRKVMMQSGFMPITSEWWHFSICKREDAATRYTLVP